MNTRIVNNITNTYFCLKTNTNEHKIDPKDY